jgi:hypothetical protein
LKVPERIDVAEAERQSAQQCLSTGICISGSGRHRYAKKRGSPNAPGHAGIAGDFQEARAGNRALRRI